jgi:hypothetical protein
MMGYFHPAVLDKVFKPLISEKMIDSVMSNIF